MDEKKETMREQELINIFEDARLEAAIDVEKWRAQYRPVNLLADVLRTYGITTDHIKQHILELQARAFMSEKVDAKHAMFAAIAREQAIDAFYAAMKCKKNSLDYFMYVSYAFSRQWLYHVSLSGLKNPRLV